MLIQNTYKPVTNVAHFNMSKVGSALAPILKRFPIQNSCWYPYGNEFITSLKFVMKDNRILDPWLRTFSEASVKNMKSIKTPEEHMRIPTTVDGTVIFCNVYFNELMFSSVPCACESTPCQDCIDSRIKIIYHPYYN